MEYVQNCSDAHTTLQHVEQCLQINIQSSVVSYARRILTTLDGLDHEADNAQLNLDLSNPVRGPL
jgi:hypothetical protein